MTPELFKKHRENKLGQIFVNKLKDNYFVFDSFTDKDSPNRTQHSRWDALLILKTRTVFIEFKKNPIELTENEELTERKFSDAKSLLRPDQYAHFIKYRKAPSHTDTLIIEFCKNGVRIWKSYYDFCGVVSYITSAYPTEKLFFQSIGSFLHIN